MRSEPVARIASFCPAKVARWVSGIPGKAASNSVSNRPDLTARPLRGSTRPYMASCNPPPSGGALAVASSSACAIWPLKRRGARLGAHAFRLRDLPVEAAARQFGVERLLPLRHLPVVLGESGEAIALTLHGAADWRPL